MSKQTTAISPADQAALAADMRALRTPPARKQPITLTLSPRACYVLAEALDNMPETPWDALTDQQREDAQHLANILWASADRNDTH